MNPLIKKEMRLLLPAWIAAMLLAVAPCWIIYYCTFGALDIFDFPPPVSIIFGMLFLGITSFGSEISFKTFPLLLSQPVSRERIWRIKIALLGAAFISILAASIISWLLFVLCQPANFRFFLNAFGGAPFWIFAFTFSSGGLWATLLLRQVIGAFWVALFAPVAISMVVNVASLFWPISDQCEDIIISIVCVGYAIAGFFYARRLFIQAQDTQWLEGMFTFTWRKGRSEQAMGSVLRGRQHRLVALILKEFQIHQVNILIAVVVLVLHIASVAVRKIHPHFDDPYIKGVLDQIWSLWLLIPLLIGSSAIAEERKLGVMESQLCLPVSRRVQLFIKFFVALVLSLVLGGLMPLLIEKTEIDYALIFVAAAIFFISFYASSVSRTTIQAIGLAIIVGGILSGAQMAYVFISYASHSFLNSYRDYEYVWLEIFVAAGILLLLFTWLSFRNFKWLHQTGKVLKHDALALGLSFVAIAVLTNAIYFRTWEFLMPVEAAHGPARLSASTLPRFLIGDGAVYAMLPDGRLWAEEVRSYDIDSAGDMYLRSDKRCWIGGSNWMAAAVCETQLLAIQSNGTLWRVQSYPAPQFKMNRLGSGTDWDSLIKQQDEQFKMNRLGSDTNWTQIAGSSYWDTDFSFLLLKNDGTLWVSGWKLPQQVVGGTNFACIVPDVYGIPRAGKKDGSVWYAGRSEKDSAPRLYRSSSDLESIHDVPFAGGHVRLDTNGDLSFFPYRDSRSKVKDRHPNGIPIGENEKWKAVAPVDNFGFNMIFLALRDDGTLWQFKTPDWGYYIDNVDLEYWLKQIRMVQLGVHSDWLALLHGSEPGYGTSPIALAADGGLWIWDQPSRHVWLVPSRRPVYFGNIFQAASGNP